MKKIRFSNGATTTITPDPIYRPASIVAEGPDGAGGLEARWTSGTYLYDGSGNIKAIGDQTFVYDEQACLKEANVQGQARSIDGTFSLSYSYDLYGNMMNRDWSKVGDPTAEPPAGFGINHTYDKNQIEESEFDYDLNGNMTRLTSAVSQSEAASWDAQKRMLAYSRNGSVVER